MSVKGEHVDIQITGADHLHWYQVNHYALMAQIQIFGLWPIVGLHAITHTYKHTQTQGRHLIDTSSTVESVAPHMYQLKRCDVVLFGQQCGSLSQFIDDDIWDPEIGPGKSDCIYATLHWVPFCKVMVPNLQ